MNTTIFKTGSRLSNSTIGIGKIVINFTGGSQVLVPGLVQGTFIGLHIQRKQSNVEGVFETFKVRVFNGHLLLNDFSEYAEIVAPISITMTESTDSEGNIIRDYSIASDIGVNQDQYFRWTIGTTRIEVFTDNVNYAGLHGLENTHLTEPEMNIEQFAFTPFTTIFAYYAEKAYGDIKAFKNRTDIKKVFISGSNVTGDINNFAKSALNITEFSFYNSKVYGELSTLLESMKRAGVRNKTISASVSGTGITYNGVSLTSIINMIFDENGNYTVQQVS